MSSRKNVLSQLAIVLAEVTQIKTVVRSLIQDFDITQYSQSQLPLVVVPEPLEETFDEMTDQRSVMELATILRVYFVFWGISPDAAYEALMTAIRNKLGNNFTLNSTAIICRVAGASIILGTMPVYDFTIRLEVKYYLTETNV